MLLLGTERTGIAVEFLALMDACVVRAANNTLYSGMCIQQQVAQKGHREPACTLAGLVSTASRRSFGPVPGPRVPVFAYQSVTCECCCASTSETAKLCTRSAQ